MARKWFLIILVLIIGLGAVYFTFTQNNTDTTAKTYTVEYHSVVLEKKVKWDTETVQEQFLLDANVSDVWILTLFPREINQTLSAVTFQGNQKQTILDVNGLILFEGKPTNTKLEYMFTYPLQRNTCSLNLLIPKKVLDNSIEEMKTITENILKFQDLNFSCDEINRVEKELMEKLIPSTDLILEFKAKKPELLNVNYYLAPGIRKQITQTPDGKITEQITFDENAEDLAILHFVPKTWAQTTQEMQVQTNMERRIILEDPVEVYIEQIVGVKFFTVKYKNPKLVSTPCSATFALSDFWINVLSEEQLTETVQKIQERLNQIPEFNCSSAMAAEADIHPAFTCIDCQERLDKLAPEEQATFIEAIITQMNFELEGRLATIEISIQIRTFANECMTEINEANGETVITGISLDEFGNYDTADISNDYLEQTLDQPNPIEVIDEIAEKSRTCLEEKKKEKFGEPTPYGPQFQSAVGKQVSQEQGNQTLDFTVDLKFKEEENLRRQLQKRYSLPEDMFLFVSEHFPEITKEYMFANSASVPSLGNDWQSPIPGLKEISLELKGRIHVAVNGVEEPFRLRVMGNATDWIEYDPSAEEILGESQTVSFGPASISPVVLVVEQYNLNSPNFINFLDTRVDALDFGALEWSLKKTRTGVSIDNLTITPELMPEKTEITGSAENVIVREVYNERDFTEQGQGAFKLKESIELTQTQPFAEIRGNGKTLYAVSLVENGTELIVKRAYPQSLQFLNYKLKPEDPLTGNIVLDYGPLFGGTETVQVTLENNYCETLGQRYDYGESPTFSQFYADCLMYESGKKFQEAKQILAQSKASLQEFLKANKPVQAGLQEIGTTETLQGFQNYIANLEGKTTELYKETFVWDLVSKQDLLHRAQCNFPEINAQQFLGIQFNQLKQALEAAKFYTWNCEGRKKLLEAEEKAKTAIQEYAFELKSINNTASEQEQNLQVYLGSIEHLNEIQSEKESLEKTHYALEQMQAITLNILFPDAIEFLEGTRQGTELERTQGIEYFKRQQNELKAGMENMEVVESEILEKFDTALTELKGLNGTEKLIKILEAERDLEIQAELLERDPGNLQIQQALVQAEYETDLAKIEFYPEEERQELQKQAREKKKEHLRRFAFDNAFQKLAYQKDWIEKKLAKITQTEQEEFSKWRIAYDVLYDAEEVFGLNAEFKATLSERRTQLQKLQTDLDVLVSVFEEHQAKGEVSLVAVKERVKTTKPKIKEGYTTTLPELAQYLEGRTLNYFDQQNSFNFAGNGIKKNYANGEEILVQVIHVQPFGVSQESEIQDIAKIVFRPEGIELFNTVRDPETGEVQFENSPTETISRASMEGIFVTTPEWVPKPRTGIVKPLHQIANVYAKAKPIEGGYTIEAIALNEKCIESECPFEARILPEEKTENNPTLAKWIEFQKQFEENQEIKLEDEKVYAFQESQKYCDISMDFCLEQVGSFLEEFEPGKQATAEVEGKTGTQNEIVYFLEESNYENELQNLLQEKVTAQATVLQVEQAREKTEFARGLADLRGFIVPGEIIGVVVLKPLVKAGLLLGKPAMFVFRTAVKKGGPAFIHVTEFAIGKGIAKASTLEEKTLLAKGTIYFLKGAQTTVDLLKHEIKVPEKVSSSAVKFWKSLPTPGSFRTKLNKLAEYSTQKWPVLRNFSPKNSGKILRIPLEQMQDLIQTAQRKIVKIGDELAEFRVGGLGRQCPVPAIGLSEFEKQKSNIALFAGPVANPPCRLVFGLFDNETNESLLGIEEGFVLEVEANERGRLAVQKALEDMRKLNEIVDYLAEVGQTVGPANLIIPPETRAQLARTQVVLEEVAETMGIQKAKGIALGKTPAEVYSELESLVPPILLNQGEQKIGFLVYETGTVPKLNQAIAKIQDWIKALRSLCGENVLHSECSLGAAKEIKKLIETGRATEEKIAAILKPGQGKVLVPVTEKAVHAEIVVPAQVNVTRVSPVAGKEVLAEAAVVGNEVVVAPAGKRITEIGVNSGTTALPRKTFYVQDFAQETTADRFVATSSQEPLEIVVERGQLEVTEVLIEHNPGIQTTVVGVRHESGKIVVEVQTPNPLQEIRVREFGSLNKLPTEQEIKQGLAAEATEVMDIANRTALRLNERLVSHASTPAALAEPTFKKAVMREIELSGPETTNVASISFGNFKAINDAFGEETVDREILNRVAELLPQKLEARGLRVKYFGAKPAVGRTYADNFYVLFERPPKTTPARQFASFEEQMAYERAQENSALQQALSEVEEEIQKTIVRLPRIPGKTQKIEAQLFMGTRNGMIQTQGMTPEGHMSELLASAVAARETAKIRAGIIPRWAEKNGSEVLFDPNILEVKPLQFVDESTRRTRVLDYLDGQTQFRFEETILIEDAARNQIGTAQPLALEQITQELSESQLEFARIARQLEDGILSEEQGALALGKTVDTFNQRTAKIVNAAYRDRSGHLIGSDTAEYSVWKIQQEQAPVTVLKGDFDGIGILNSHLGRKRMDGALDLSMDYIQQEVRKLAPDTIFVRAGENSDEFFLIISEQLSDEQVQTLYASINSRLEAGVRMGNVRTGETEFTQVTLGYTQAKGTPAQMLSEATEATKQGKKIYPKKALRFNRTEERLPANQSDESTNILIELKQSGLDVDSAIGLTETRAPALRPIQIPEAR